MDVHLLKGFGPLVFGDTQKECLKHFGEPDEREQLEGIDGSINIVWHYWENGFSIFFDENMDGKFCCVEVDDTKPLSIFNQSVFGKREEEVITLLESNGYRVSDTEQHEWGERRISFDDIFADFYFEKGRLVSVNYSVPLTE